MVPRHKFNLWSPEVRTLISWTRGAKAGSSGPVNPTETVKRMAVVSLDMPIGGGGGPKSFLCQTQNKLSQPQLQCKLNPISPQLMLGLTRI